MFQDAALATREGTTNSKERLLAQSPQSPTVFTTCREIQQHALKCRQQGRRIGVVPTMGALHDGHRSLVRASLGQVDETIVTIFVNPTQFAPSEDLAKYPRPFEDDLQLLGSLGIATVFAPSEQEMYPSGSSTAVLPPMVSKVLEGENRPTHFGGVATVVLKLFQLTCADVAFFGQKDYQQVAVIRQMIADFNLPVELVACPIVREADGLALSSRNIYLSDEERQIALSLHRTLEYVEREIEAGERDGHLLMAAMRQMLIDGGVTIVDYAVVADPQTLEIQDDVRLPAVALLAAYVGATRLIDNRILIADH